MSFPNFRQKQVNNLIKVIIGNVDQRTLKNYFDRVTSYSTPDKIKGEYDVTQFCNIVGA